MAKKNEIWQKIHKEYVKLVVPNRMSVDDMKIYARLIKIVLKSKKGQNVMLMGSTPELRRFLFTYTRFFKATIYCVDSSRVMYKAMGDFITKGDLQEKFINADWLKTGLPDDFFDLIIGDEVICNVPIKDHKKLFKEVSRVSKSSGYWITRHNFYLSNKIKTEDIVLEIVDDLTEKKYSFQEAINYIFILLFYNLAAKNKKHCLNQRQELKEMEKIYTSLKPGLKKEVLKELIRNFKEDWQTSFNYYWHVLSKKESEKELKPFFEMKEVLYAHDYITAGNSPIYLLKKK